MNGQVKLTGMVLTAMPVNDYDRRITILTKERGKITAFAKGARRPTSAFVANTQPFAFGEFTLFEGREAYNVVSAEISNYFSELRNDLSAIYYGMYFCELAGFISRENMEAKEQLRLLYQTLRALTKPSLDHKLVRAVYELRLMAVYGVSPQTFNCLSCGEDLLKKGEKIWFSPEDGGAYCDGCLSDMDGGEYSGTDDETARNYAKNTGRFQILPSTLYAMQFILTEKLETLYTFTVSSEVLLELQLIMKYYLQKHIGSHMKSEDMLNLI
ncbi:MAG: DNA repair protein RecO [Lachnospiraceae bacterium]|nr:DNA repair protein RecO [Lachnospiraceae bacterium]